MQEVPGSGIQTGLAWFTEDSPANVQTEVDGATIKPPGITHPSKSLVLLFDGEERLMLRVTPHFSGLCAQLRWSAAFRAECLTPSCL